MDEKRELTQILNNYGPLRGNVERQIIMTPPVKEGGSRDAGKDGEGARTARAQGRRR